ncbi:MAG: hypothetical protein RLN70_03215, partial [Rhodospirillaceae bacterium]
MAKVLEHFRQDRFRRGDEFGKALGSQAPPVTAKGDQLGNDFKSKKQSASRTCSESGFRGTPVRHR